MNTSEMLQNIIHELIHFYWFAVWNSKMTKLTH